MKVWKGNSIDSPEYELSPSAAAESFLASEYGDMDEYPWPVERALAAHLMYELGVGWQPKDEGFYEIADEIMRQRREKKET